MKRLLLMFVLLAFILLAGKTLSQSLFSQVHEMNYENNLTTELEAYVAAIEGNWITDTRTYLYDEPEAYENFVRIAIDPANIEGDEIKIVVNEYCWPEFAQYLYFKLEDNKLVYTGASINNCRLDYHRIDYIYISYQKVKGETMLVYEAQEMESQNYIREVLVRTEPDLLGNIQIEKGLENHLIALLKEEHYTIYDTLGNWVMPKAIFGSEIEAEYIQGPTTIWFTEGDISTKVDFAVLLTGGKNPWGPGDIYGIEWYDSRIDLFETYWADNEDRRLLKGDLVYTIVLDSDEVFP